MSFPPQFLDELRERILLSQLIGKKVKLTKRGREYTGLCPFHHEKTPSFTINDDKGFYHCFGCGAHGDIVRYLTDCEKMPFLEAVEYLAHMAGLSMPQSSPEAVQRQTAHKNELAIMEEACLYFQQQLFSERGEKARTYFKNRGITAQIAKQFRLGYAPRGSGLTARLKEKGLSLKTAASLGLIVENMEKKSRHDYFYDRVMFPILNRRKQVIAFGGRLLEKGEPKYLNSPETALFHKGEQLYALANAIETIRKKNQAILVEGYMDVIALHSAGFTNAVAPLGTAFTENQLQLLWQSCDEPLICFDGDAAGRKAAIRAMNRAIPILTPGKSLQFVFLPDSFDPDDMIRKKSPQAFQDALSGAKTLSWTLWNSLIENRTLDTPERRAKLEKDATTIIETIKHEKVRNYYLKDLKSKLWQLEHQTKNKKSTLSFKGAQAISKPLAGRQEGRMLLAYLICYPHIAQNMLETMTDIQLNEAQTQEQLSQIIELLIENPDYSSEQIKDIIFIQKEIPLPTEVEMLQKSNRSDLEVEKELNKWLQTLRLQSLIAEKDEKLKAFAQNSTMELWQEINSLKKEIEKLSTSE